MADPWTPVRPILADLLTLQARIERLRLADKLLAAEIRLRALGMDTAPLMAVRKALLSQSLTGQTPMFPPVPPRKGGLRHLVVRESSRG